MVSKRAYRWVGEDTVSCDSIGGDDVSVFVVSKFVLDVSNLSLNFDLDARYTFFFSPPFIFLFLPRALRCITSLAVSWWLRATRVTRCAS